ncbi:MAG TPA: hypothetical protein VHW43_07335 [Puia sp.]|nr:hypothetical protein [Puia sp.]
MQEDNGPFVYDEDGFTYQVDGRIETVKWAEISRIEAVKLDRPEYDVICLRLYWERGEFSISEDEPGWYQFVSRLQAVLPLEQGWEERVIESADDSKGTPLWPISRLPR